MGNLTLFWLRCVSISYKDSADGNYVDACTGIDASFYYQINSLGLVNWCKDLFLSIRMILLVL